MPRISHFHGISVYIYYRDHSPPHFRAICGEDEATVDIETGLILDGDLPRSARRLVEKWLDLHRDELRSNWRRARQGLPLDPVDPLA